MESGHPNFPCLICLCRSIFHSYQRLSNSYQIISGAYQKLLSNCHFIPNAYQTIPLAYQKNDVKCLLTPPFERPPLHIFLDKMFH